jgi:hypothetical protein
MSSRAISISVGAFLALATALMRNTPVVTWYAHESASDSCTVDVLGRGVVVDTLRMRRVSRSSAPSESAEGGKTTVYYQGDRPRVITIQYFGETGQAIVRYYLTTPQQYVVQREELRYAAPVSVQSHPVIVSRLPSTLYVCAGKSVDPLDADEKHGIQTDMDSTLIWLQNRAGH